MKKKGFTLIELLAVIVVLAILMLVASSNVFGILDEARKRSFQTEFFTLLQAAENKANLDIMDQALSNKKSHACYTETDLENYFQNKGDYTFSVYVTYQNRKLTVEGWMSNDKYIITDKQEDLALSDVEDNDGSAASTNCGGKATS